MNRIIAAIFITACLSNSGCNRSEEFDQSYHENFFASKIARALELNASASEKTPAVTNLLLLTNYFRIEFLADYEQKFLRYGRDAGFTNSLLEKYIVLPKVIKGPTPDEGEIVLISSKPLKKKNGRIERIFVGKYPKLANSYGVDWIEEEKFQEALLVAGISLSNVSGITPMPSMRHLCDPDGKIAATRKMISEEGAKEVKRYEREHPTPLLEHPYFPYACLAALTIAVGGVLWWFYRSGSKSHR